MLRGRAPFSCGKKRALPLKLPLPPKTAHGKARSTRLPLFRAKNTRRGSDNRNAARRMSAIPAPPAACRQEQHARPCCASRRPPAKLHIQPQVPLDAPEQRFFKERKLGRRDVGVRGKNLRLPGSLCFLFPSRQRQALIKFFGVEGEREGEAAPFVHKRGASPSHLSFPPTAGDPARAGRWPRPHGRERWRPCPPSRRWYGPDAAPGCRRGRRGPGRARPAP